MTPKLPEPVAWQHESKECSLGAAGMHNIITTEVRNLWLKANPRQVEHYTKPLHTADQMLDIHAQGYRSGLERAAEICDKQAREWKYGDVEWCAAAIRKEIP